MEKMILRDLLDKIQSMNPAGVVITYGPAHDLADAARNGFEFCKASVVLMALDAIERLEYMERRDAALVAERAAKEKV